LFLDIELSTVLLADLLEIKEVYLTLVIRIGLLFYFSNKLGPFLADLSAELHKQLYVFIGVQLLMKVTIVQIVLSRLEALVVLAALKPSGFGFILSKVKALLWK